MLISPDGVPVSGGGVGEVSVSRNCGGDIFQSQGHVREKKILGRACHDKDHPACDHRQPLQELQAIIWTQLDRRW